MIVGASTGQPWKVFINMDNDLIVFLSHDEATTEMSAISLGIWTNNTGIIPSRHRCATDSGKYCLNHAHT